MCFSSLKNSVNDSFLPLLMTGNESFRASVGQRWRFHFFQPQGGSLQQDFSLLRAALQRSPRIQDSTTGLQQTGKGGAGEHVRNTCAPGWEFKNVVPFAHGGTMNHQKFVCMPVFLCSLSLSASHNQRRDLTNSVSITMHSKKRTFQHRI